MKNFKRFLLGVVFATLVFATCGMSAMATTTTKTLKQNTWFTQKNNGKYAYNKITIPNDGYITITMQKTNKDSVWIDLCDKNKNFIGYPVSTSDKKVTVHHPVRKGTYYLYGSPDSNYKYKWKFTKAVNKSNYMVDKAISLAKNKEVVVVNTPKAGYDRWYKIKLTKKQAINYWVSGCNSEGVYLYDDEMQRLAIQYDRDEDVYSTQMKLPKGTYYVRVLTSYYYSGVKASLTTFKWK